MLARTAFLTSFAFALLAACGGNVVVDQPLNGGAGGTSTTSSSSSSGSSGTNTVTTTTSSTTTWVGPCGGLALTPDPSCQSCLEGSCCAELSACAPGSACAQLHACSQQCLSKDYACEEKCLGVYGAGVQPLSNLTACANAGCAADSCLGSACNVVQAPGPFCDACVSQHLCAEFSACSKDPDCAVCIYGGQPGCESNPLFNDILLSVAQWCGQACFFN